MNRPTKPLAFLCLISVLMVCISCNKDKSPETPEKTETGDLPYTKYMLTDYGSYIEIPHDTELNPVDGITLEGWVRLDNTAVSNLLIHKRLYYEKEGYTVEVTEQDDKPLLGSYMGYANSQLWAGNFPIHTWLHWAVSSDGATRKHYINGELAGEFTEESGVFEPSTEPLLIAKTVPANTGLAEFRLWNTVRSQAEIKSTMNQDIESAMPGLIAVWPFETDANDIIGGHHGIMHNNPKFKTWSE